MAGILGRSPGTSPVVTGTVPHYNDAVLPRERTSAACPQEHPTRWRIEALPALCRRRALFPACKTDYSGHMSTTRKTVSVTELKAHLSEQLRRVKAGESVLITEHGRPIGMMTPLPGNALSDELADLAEAGLVRLAAAKPDGKMLQEDRPADPRASVRGALLEERRESR